MPDKDSATSDGDREALFVTTTVRAPRSAAAAKLAAASGIGCPARINVPSRSTSKASWMSTSAPPADGLPDPAAPGG